MIYKLHRFVHSRRLFTIFTWFTRRLLAIGFLPSGYTKLIGQRFTQIPIENPVGFFFEALYQSGFYWHFLGALQMLTAILLLIPRTSFFGALLYLPIIINIFVIVTSMEFKGTPFIVGLMLLANLYLLFWDLAKVQKMTAAIFNNS